MRWDQIRSGLLAGPMGPPGSVAEMQRLPQAEVFTDRVSATPNTDKAIGGDAQAMLQDLQLMPHIATPQTAAQGGLAEHLQPATHNIMGSPQLNAALKELSGIVQGRDIGTNFDADAGPQDDESALNLQAVDPSYRDIFKRKRR